MEDKERVQAIDSLARLYLVQKNTYKATIVANLGASQDIIDMIVDQCLENQEYYRGTEAAETGASRGKIELLLQAVIKEGFTDLVTRLLNILERGLTEEEGNNLMLRSLERDLSFAFEAATCAGRELSSEEIKFWIEKHGGRKVVFDVERVPSEKFKNAVIKNLVELGRAATAQKLLSNQTPQEIINLVVKGCIKEDKLDTGIESASLGASQKTVLKLLESCIKKAHVDGALGTARLLKRKLTIQEVDRLMKSCIKTRDVVSAIKVASVTMRRLTPDEVASLMEISIEDCNVAGAVRLSKYSKEKLKKEEIELLLKNALQKGYGDTAIKAAKMLKRVLLPAEIDALVKYWLPTNIWVSVRLAKLGATPHCIELVIKKCVGLGYLEEALAATGIAGRDLTTEEIIQLKASVVRGRRISQGVEVS